MFASRQSIFNNKSIWKYVRRKKRLRYVCTACSMVPFAADMTHYGLSTVGSSSFTNPSDGDRKKAIALKVQGLLANDCYWFGVLVCPEAELVTFCIFLYSYIEVCFTVPAKAVNGRFAFCCPSYTFNQVFTLHFFSLCMFMVLSVHKSCTCQFHYHCVFLISLQTKLKNTKISLLTLISITF